MNTKFKILWYEDELSWYDSIVLDVDNIIQDHQLEPQINRRLGDDLSVTDLTVNEFDLIIMDYRLISGQTGDRIIQKIRDAHILTDVLFYSSQYDTMIEAIKGVSPPIDGIYTSDRKNFVCIQSPCDIPINAIQI